MQSFFCMIRNGCMFFIQISPPVFYLPQSSGLPPVRNNSVPVYADILPFLFSPIFPVQVIFHSDCNIFLLFCRCPHTADILRSSPLHIYCSTVLSVADMHHIPKRRRKQILCIRLLRLFVIISYIPSIFFTASSRYGLSAL